MPRAVSASEASLRKLTVALKAENAENSDLPKQNEVFGSYVLKNRELKKQISQLEAQHQKSKANTEFVERKLVTNLELQDSGITLNSTLEKLIADTPEGIVATAIQSLKQAQQTGNVKILEDSYAKQLLIAGLLM